MQSKQNSCAHTGTMVLSRKGCRQMVQWSCSRSSSSCCGEGSSLVRFDACMVVLSNPSWQRSSHPTRSTLHTACSTPPAPETHPSSSKPSTQVSPWTSPTAKVRPPRHTPLGDQRVTQETPSSCSHPTPATRPSPTPSSRATQTQTASTTAVSPSSQAPSSKRTSRPSVISSLPAQIPDSENHRRSRPRTCLDAGICWRCWVPRRAMSARTCLPRPVRFHRRHNYGCSVWSAAAAVVRFPIKFATFNRRNRLASGSYPRHVYTAPSSFPSTLRHSFANALASTSTTFPSPSGAPIRPCAPASGLATDTHAAGVFRGIDAISQSTG
jgi:hypothetical protein